MKKSYFILFFLVIIYSCVSKKNVITVDSINVDNNQEFEFSNLKYKVEKYHCDTLCCIQGVVSERYGEIMPFSSVIIQNKKSSFFKSKVTELENSYFTIDSIPEGKYQLRVVSLGYGEFLLNNIMLKKGELITLDTIQLIESVTLLKPIIYFYTDSITDIEVKLDYNGQISCTYPVYEETWKVTAYPDGTIKDKKGQEYYCLYWEGIPNYEFNIKSGFVVEGLKTIEFLEESLEVIGLNRREANEFIIYWLPKMEKNKYNLVHFSTDFYTDNAKLTITPKPESSIRFMMYFQPFDYPVIIPKQNLEDIKVTRKGFTIVEWGGTELPRLNKERK